MEKLSGNEFYSSEGFNRVKLRHDAFFADLFNRDREKWRDCQKDMADKADELKNNFGEDMVTKVAMYHILTGGGSHIEDQKIETDDLEGENSIERFLQNLEAKYGQE